MKASPEQYEVDEQELEILKAVAQAWYGHSGNLSSTSEYDARRQNFQTQPSRFKREAMNKSSAKALASPENWDFKQSLLDSYELVSVSKRLERGLPLDDPFTGLDTGSRVHRKKRESKNSLRRLFNMVSSSKKFNETDVNTQF